MRTELETQDIEAIALRVTEYLKPILASNQTVLDELLTVDELANFLKTSKAQIYQWVNQSQHGLGNFPYFKAGKLLRFSKNAILKWLETR